jgi:hypothetical protein
MRPNLLLRLLPSTVLFGAAIGQGPTGNAPAAPRPEVALQSLQALTSETVYRLHPLDPAQHEHGTPAASGTTAFSPFARIRDARFERSGQLRELIVEAAESDPAASPERRILPAKAVEWDAPAKRWRLVDGNLAFPTLVADQKPLTPPQHTDPVLASELVVAKVCGQPGTAQGKPEAEATEASATKTAKPEAVVWFVPAQQSLCLAVVPNGTRHVPLPWSLLRVMGNGKETQLLIDVNPQLLQEAPACASATEVPDGRLRQRCYEHFALPCPSWDKTEGEAKATEAGKDPKRVSGR